MRIAVLSDIHGNLPALEAVLAELRESLLEPVGSAFIARHFEARATR